MTLRVVLEYDEVIDSWAAYCPEMPESCRDVRRRLPAPREMS